MQIESKPGSVRGLGNVCNLKSVDDFVCNHSSIESEVTSDGTVYCMSNIRNPVVWFYTLPSEIKQGVVCNLSFGLKNSSESVLTGKSVKVYVDDTLMTTKTTGVGGRFTYTLDTTGYGLRRLRLEFNGDGEYAPNTLSVNVMIKRKVNYTVQYAEIRDGITKSYHIITCKTDDTNEPVQNVKVHLDTNEDGITNSDGVWQSTYTFPPTGKKSVTCSLDNHYFVEVN